MMKAVNFQWDFDYGEEVTLPNEIEIIEEISDYLSDFTGYCHKGFEMLV